MFRIFLLTLLGAGQAINQLPKTGFSCQGRSTGYYADVESGCQVYHMCDGLGRQFSYTCPNATLFQQRMLICDHWYMVNCSKSIDNYGANLRIGRKMPFVDDSETNRTPRPDLLAHRSQSEYDIIYRTGRAQYGTNLNLVGAESDKNKSTTDEPAYSLPSHWSTQLAHATTPKSLKIKKITKAKPATPSVPETQVNFKSNFKATTPVYPKTVEYTTLVPDKLDLAPPLPYKIKGASNRPQQVNFESNFKATTPVYPLTVEPTSEEPSHVGLLPPNNTVANSAPVPALTLDFLPPEVDKNFSPKNREPQIQEPSKFYQPPKFQPDFTEAKKGGFKALSSNEWEDLRKKFLIPDYEFPLESVSRPSYDSVLSSFQASGVPSGEK